MQTLVRLALESLGMLVLTANDGEEALQIVRQYAGTIDALVSDIVMPHLDGVALCEQIRRDHPGMKVLLMSGGCDGPNGVPFLRKPFSMEELTQCVQQLVAAS